jgi:hypothetical protein
VTFRESADLVKKTAQERGYTAPVLLDASGDVAGRVYGVWGPPTAYLIDRQGRLVGRIQGARDWSAPAARNLLRALVEEIGGGHEEGREALPPGVQGYRQRATAPPPRARARAGPA